MSYVVLEPVLMSNDVSNLANPRFSSILSSICSLEIVSHEVWLKFRPILQSVLLCSFTHFFYYIEQVERTWLTSTLRCLGVVSERSSCDQRIFSVGTHNLFRRRPDFGWD